MAKKEISIPVILEHYQDDENWRAYLYGDSVIQAEGPTPEAATQALVPEIEHFISDPVVDPNQRALHKDRLENAPEIRVTQVKVAIPDKS